MLYNLLPNLATDVLQHQIRFPCIVQPKIDGVRGLNLYGKLTGRKLRCFNNRHVTMKFSDYRHQGLDGELIAGEITDIDLCRKTTSALNTITGTPDITWYVFDLVTPHTIHLLYKDRYSLLQKTVDTLESSHIILVSYKLCNNLIELLTAEEEYLAMGFEGIIIRAPNGRYKSGRSTVSEGGLLRLKRFIEEEALVIKLLEGQSNQNEAQLNYLGLTERSTHQDNMIANGMVASMVCKLCKNIKNPTSGEILFPAGHIITVSAGSMPHAQRREYFKHPEMLLGKVIKFKTFPYGVKDKPRFPTFVTIRADSDR